ncbi:hypothetical protein LVJ94_48235 [Pendulispora rubella]|uniref:Uncharacterized protein n=1 Tax=Pendulispora rubella TaxID=2741070 RepID=A0ABZ2L174_9BACT
MLSRCARRVLVAMSLVPVALGGCDDDANVDRRIPDGGPLDASPDAWPDAHPDARSDADPDASTVSQLDRERDPVVFTGAEAAPLLGKRPASLVAFAYGAEGWRQIPLQVDERVQADLGKISGNSNANGVTVNVYADPATSVGADVDLDVDADDEIVLMASDTGARAMVTQPPAGTVDGSGVEVTVRDALNEARTRYAYLFVHDGSLDSAAGKKYATYAFARDSSTVTTEVYAQHFLGRWISDELRIKAGTGVDILDRNKTYFAPGQGCGENEESFNSCGGPFLANKDGAVRAIRAYMGACSGAHTERDHVFYAARADIRTILRVHAIPSIIDAIGYSPDAKGMMYFSNRLPSGDAIDGIPAASAPQGKPEWELVTGPQGSVSWSLAIDTDLPNPVESYYDDNASHNECTGSGHAYGLSGTYVSQQLPCTDPVTCKSSARRLSGTRIAYFGAPGWTASDAAKLDALAKRPLTATCASITF